jgi:hypothetical protein
MKMFPVCDPPLLEEVVLEMALREIQMDYHH